MESAFGHDFSRVRLHTDARAAAVSGTLNARAFAYGSDIAFGAGQYKPGTLIGDTLLAHELAHVVQQEESTMPSGGRDRSPEASNALEQDADLSAVGAIAALWSGVKHVALDIARQTAPRLRSGLQLHRCTESQKKQAPPFLGPDSLEALQEIDRVVENSALLSKMIVFGTVAVAASHGPEEHVATGGPGHEIEAAAEALRAVPEIRRSRIETIISLLLVEHENQMNEQERTFWHNMLDNIQRRK